MKSQLSSLPSSPTSDETIRVMAGQCWRQRGIAVLWPEEIEDPWIRQAVINVAVAKYGKSEVMK